MAVAISAAATSSDTSPGSSRATTISLMPGRVQRRDLGGADQRSLLEHERALADGVHGGRAERVLGRDRSEFHDAALTGARSGCVDFLAQPLGDLRDDRDRDLGRRHRADIEPDRRVDAGEMSASVEALAA